MIRVAHVITSLTTGGAESMLTKLLLAMDRGRFASEVICLTQNGYFGPILEESGFPVHILGMRREWPWPAKAQSLLQRFADFKPDVVQGWMYHGNIAALGLAQSKRVVWNIRNTISVGLKDERWTTRKLVRMGTGWSKKPSHVIYNSRQSRVAHEAIGYYPDNAVVIPNGFVLDRFKPNPEIRERTRKLWGVSGDMMVFGLVARFHRNKDHLNFLQAARKFLDLGNKALFVLVGPQVNDLNTDLSAWIRDLHLQDSVLLLGEKHNLQDITPAFDVAVLSSKIEGFPNVFGEAMACEIPCLGTDVGDTAWLVGDTGAIVPPRDSEALAHGMIRMLNAGADGRAAMGIQARRRVEERFSMDAVAQIYENLYIEVAEGNRLKVKI